MPYVDVSTMTPGAGGMLIANDNASAQALSGTMRIISNAGCYNTTDGSGGYCYSMLCLE